MEASVVERYTRFPGLDYSQEEIPALASAEWKCDDCQLDIDTLILSWALVLGNLSGEENPVFQVDERTVKSHPFSRRIEDVHVDASLLENTSYTGIYTEDVSCKWSIRIYLPRSNTQNSYRVAVTNVLLRFDMISAPNVDLSYPEAA